MLWILIVSFFLPPSFSYTRQLSSQTPQAPQITYSTHVTNNNSNTINLDPQIVQLFSAVESNNVALVKELLADGVDANSRDIYYRTPLMYTSDNTLEIAKLLIQYNASINSRDSFGNTSLMIASEIGATEIVTLLLNKKALVNLKNREELTALSLAVQYGHAQIVQQLIDSAANPSIMYPNGQSLLSMAVLHGHNKIVAELLKTPNNLDELLLQSKTPLIGIASIYGYVNIVDQLIKAGADVNLNNSSGISPLFLATITRNYSIIELLLANGANIESLESEERSWKDYFSPPDRFIEKIIEEYIKTNADKLKKTYLQ